MKSLLSLVFLVLSTTLISQSFVDSVYEFEVGDEFHYEEKIGSTSSGYKTTQTIWKIIGKTYSMNQVNYQIHSYGRILIPFTPTASFSSIITKSYDTSLRLIDTLVPCSIAIPCKSDSIFNDSVFSTLYLKKENRFEYTLTERYAKKLGQIEKSEYWSDFSSPDLISKKLVYVNKINGFIWGTPYTFTSNLSESYLKPIDVFPNPAANTISIRGEFLNSKFEIYNSVGKQVMSGKLENNQIDCSHIENGVYFLKITNETDFFEIKRIVISK